MVSEILIIIILVIILFFLVKHIFKLNSELKELKSKLISKNVIHGQSMEKLFPFCKNFNYDPRDFRFIGMPIDGMVFEEDKITFIEFKTGKSKLSENQENIKRLVEDKKVYWEEIRD